MSNVNARLDYFCTTCNRVIKPYELETSTYDGKKAWKHKACGQHTVIRTEPLPPKPETAEDLFDD